ncbi:MAG: discoidin domain-containing protein [Alphaproteobacteria bacterium]|nr:discoidin domain-containing protein [Alphaproteobacteria bacterium]
MRTRSLLVVAALALPLVASAGFSVSSYKKKSRTSGASEWDVAAALDGNPATAWQVDPENDNLGQWIEIDVPKGKVDKISTVVGWAESDDTWADHARLKEARLEVFTMAGGEQKLVLEKTLTFEDKRETQVVDLPDTQVGDELEGGKVRLTVTAVYPGKDYDNLAVGEVLVTLVEFDASVRKFEEASSTDEGHPGDNLVDDSTKTFWASSPRDDAPSFSVSAGPFSASTIGIVQGPKTHARPKKIEVVQNNAVLTYEMADKSTIQWFALPPLFGYNGSNSGPITVRIVESYPGTETVKSVGVADIRWKATALDAF